MSITSMDIQNQVFGTARHGYDAEEVDLFLEQVAYELDAYADELAEYSNRLQGAEQQLGSAEQRIRAAEQKAISFEQKATAADQRAVAAERKAAAAEERANDTSAQTVADGRVRELEAQLAELETKLRERKHENEDTIAAAIITAQRAADQLREEARAEGERIYREAESKARDLLRDAMAEKQSIIDEMGDLKLQRDGFRSEYQALLKGFMQKAETVFEGASKQSTVPVDVKAEAQNLLHGEEAEAVPAAAPAAFADEAVIEPAPAVEFTEQVSQTATEQAAPVSSDTSSASAWNSYKAAATQVDAATVDVPEEDVPEAESFIDELDIEEID